MKIYERIAPLQEELRALRQAGRTIGLAPTMGHLHKGHLALVKAAKEQCDYALATIFVNPLQFGPGEDLADYPRTIQEDQEKLTAAGCDALFMPPVAEIYPQGLQHQTLVTAPAMAKLHCGKSRPGHFAGVCTVVCKLLNLVAPEVAFFGEKDYQQLQIIRKMTADLCLPARIAGVPTVREESGLACSSRNHYLTQEQRRRASRLYASLVQTRDALAGGETDFAGLEKQAADFLQEAGLRVDYYHICHGESLLPAKTGDKTLVILAAIYVGKARLIDNISCSLDDYANKAES